MPRLLIKDMPIAVHQKLKARAAQNSRSMTKEAIYLLEEALFDEMPAHLKLPTPFQGTFLLTDEWLDQAKRDGK